MKLQQAFVWSVCLFFAGIGMGLAADHAVSATASLTFSPASLTINAGDTVTFSYGGGPAHNVVSNTGLFRCAHGCDGDGAGGNGNLSTGWHATVAFPTAGTFGYFCEAHGSPGSGMHGTIIVNAVTPPPPTINLGGYLSGNWFIPTQGGSGYQLEFTSAAGSAAGTLQALAIWFVYAPQDPSAPSASSQNWIYAQGDYTTASNTVTLPAEILIGTQFPPNYVAANVHPLNGGLWGHITFTFSGCNDGTVRWHSDFTGYNGTNDTSFPIQRLTQIAGTTCPQ
jgi:plastocyanin